MMIDIHLVQTSVGGTRARTPKAVILLALNKGKCLPLSELALELRHNRMTRHIVGDVCAPLDCVHQRRWMIVLQKQLFSLCNVVRILTSPHAKRATAASYRGTMTQAMRLKVAMIGECTTNTPTISNVATVQAANLCGSFERRQIALWYDNYRRYFSGVDPNNPNNSFTVTVVVVLHTTGLPQYLGPPDLDVVAQAAP